MQIKKWKEEILKLLDNPRTGLKESSDTNKTRYAILGIIEELLEKKDEEKKVKVYVMLN